MNITRFSSQSFFGTKVNALYFNDMHGKTVHLPSFKTAVDSFQKNYEKDTNLLLASGDLHVDNDTKNNSAVDRVLEETELVATCCGNHDLEGGDFFETLIDPSQKFKWLACNLNFSKDTPLKDKIKKSTVVEKNGEKIGIIGVAPLDYKKLAFITPFNDYINIENSEETEKSIRQEVAKLESQKINKIFLLAHTGKDYYEQFAQIAGIDVILGGHDHDEVDKWFTSEANEPVKVVSTGKSDTHAFAENLDTFGVLNLDFDENGVLIKDNCSNSFFTTDNFQPSSEISDLIKTYTQEDEILAQLPRPLISNRLFEENPVADLAADAALWLINHTDEKKGKKADFAFVNSGTVRADFTDSSLSSEDIRQAYPFTSPQLIKTTLTKKQIFDTLNWGVESTKLPKVSPGLMQVSGLRYTIGKDLRVKDVCITDEKGHIKERLDDADDEKQYNVIYDNFLLSGVAGLKDLKKDPADKSVEYYRWCRQEAVIEYLKKNNDKDKLMFDTPRIIKE